MFYRTVDEAQGPEEKSLTDRLSVPKSREQNRQTGSIHPLAG